MSLGNTNMGNNIQRGNSNFKFSQEIKNYSYKIPVNTFYLAIIVIRNKKNKKIFKYDMRF